MSKEAFPNKEITEIQELTEGICNGDCFFMESLEGNSLISVIDNLSEEEKANLRLEIGKIQRQLSEIKGAKFGLLGDEAHNFNSLFDYIYFLINNVLQDAEKRDVVDFLKVFGKEECLIKYGK